MNIRKSKINAVTIRCDSDEEAVAMASYLDSIIPNGFSLEEPDITLFMPYYADHCKAFHAGYWAGERNGHAAGLDEGREAAEKEC